MRKSWISTLLALSMLAVPVFAEEEAETEEVTVEAEAEAEEETEAEAETEAQEEEQSLEDMFLGAWNLYQIDRNGETISSGADNGRAYLWYGKVQTLGAIRGEGEYTINDDSLVVTLDDIEYELGYEFFYEDEGHNERVYSEEDADRFADPDVYNRVKLIYNVSYTDTSDPLAPKKVEDEYIYYFEHSWYIFLLNLDDVLTGHSYSLESGAEMHFYLTDEGHKADFLFDGELMQEGISFSNSYNELRISFESGIVSYIVDEFDSKGFTAHNKNDAETPLRFNYEGELKQEEEEETAEEVG